jgi:hypothetical protein
MINLDFEGEKPELPFQTVGFYYKSSANNQQDYLISIGTDIVNESCVAEIFTIPTPQVKLINGQEIATCDIDKFIDLNISPKYYLIKFKDGYHQFYHDYEGNGKEDYAQGMADVINFALKLGIEQAKITLRLN